MCVGGGGGGGGGLEGSLRDMLCQTLLSLFLIDPFLRFLVKFMSLSLMLLVANFPNTKP